MNVTTIGAATSDTYLITDDVTVNTNEESGGIILDAIGEKVEVKYVIRQTGGGATNTAVAFSRLGLHTSCFCKVGTDTDGILVKGVLDKENVDCTPIITSAIFATGASYIVHNANGKHVIFVARNANEHITEDEIPYDTILKSDFLYITSLSHASSEVLPPICDFAKQNRIKIASNPGMSQLARNSEEHGSLVNMLPYLNVIIMNFAEAHVFARSLGLSIPTTLPKQDQIALFCNAIIAKGVQTVAVTDGADGVYIASHNRDQLLFHPSLECKVIDTVGAGDAFGSVFTASYFQGLPLEDCLARGLASSRSVISQIGAKQGLLTKTGLEKALKKA